MIVKKKNNRQSTKIFSEKNLRIKINIKHAWIITKFIKKTVNCELLPNGLWLLGLIIITPAIKYPKAVIPAPHQVRDKLQPDT